MCCLEFFLVLLLSPIVLADGCVVHAPTPRISQLDGNLALVDWDRKKEETFIIKYWPKESPQNDSSIPILDDHTSFQKVELERGVTYRFRLAVTTKGNILFKKKKEKSLKKSSLFFRLSKVVWFKNHHFQE